MNEYGQYGSWEEMDQARERLAATFEDPDVREHVSERASFRPRRSGWWLPAIWSERDSELRDKLIAELGPTSPSGYMSEECGWELQEPRPRHDGRTTRESRMNNTPKCGRT